MTTYIALFDLTDAGIKAAKDSPRSGDGQSVPCAIERGTSAVRK